MREMISKPLLRVWASISAGVNIRTLKRSLSSLVSHCVRPVSLSLRLMGNMLADHKVVMSFFALVPLVVPLPFLLLGLLVCLIQALVFCTLSMVYIGMAIEHEEH